MKRPLYKAKRKTFVVACETPEVPDSLETITTAAQASAYLTPFFQGADRGREHLTAVFLDGRHRPIAGKILFSGNGNETPVMVGELARQALLVGARAVIIAHNHPTRDLTPSREDEAVTRRVASALATVDIRLLDHIVVDGAGNFRVVGSG